MKKMIKIESGSFAALVRSYKKSLNMLAVLQHICQENDVALSMLPDEVCELINLDPAEIEKQRLSGRLRLIHSSCPGSLKIRISILKPLNYILP